MRIAVDTQALFSPIFKGRGIANYLQNQLQTLFDRDTENEYVLFNLYSEESALESYFGGREYPRVREFKAYTGADQFLIQQKDAENRPQFRQLLGGILRRFLQQENIDVFFYASPFDYWNYFEAEWFEGVRLVATVYDVIPYVMQDTYLPGAAERAEYMAKIELLRGFDKILAISQCVKDDLVGRLGFDAGRVDVIYAGISRFYSEGEVPQAVQAAIRRKYGIGGEFIFAAGGCDPRKNMPEMLAAYARLPEELIQRYQLVFVCKLTGDYPARLRNAACEAGLAQGRVMLTDYVPDEDQLSLYRMASLTFFASQYEGFGLPVIESMACGTPVVTSNNSSLGEIARGAAELVDPFDIEDMARGLYSALQGITPEIWENMRAKANAFTWDHSGELTMKSLDSLTPYPKPAMAEATFPARLALFTPLPPLRSGIADYALEFLQSASALAAIDVYVDEGYTPQLPALPNVRVLPHGEYPANQARYQATLYQMGNNHLCHFYMLPYVQRYGGTVELHDCNLHNMLQHYTVDIHGDVETYRKFLAEDYPSQADALIERLRSTGVAPKPAEMPLNGAVTRYADRVIVHSEYARTQLLRLDVGRKAQVVPLFAAPEVLPAKEDARAALGIEPGAFVFATFGYITGTRRIPAVLEAFAMMQENTELECLLYVTGDFESDALRTQLEAQAADANLQGRVVFTGRLSPEDMTAMVSACDVCINLRWPYYGESSAIVARVLQAGKPVVVTNIGSFAELPEDVCRKLPEPEGENEAAALAKAMVDLATNKKNTIQLGQNAQIYARAHLDRDQLVRRILDLAASPRDSHTGLEEKILFELSKYINVLPVEKQYYEILKISEMLAYLA